MTTNPTRWDLIRRLRGQRVLDIGGVGYVHCDQYRTLRDRLFAEAWGDTPRTILDINPAADIVCDLNRLPLPALAGDWDVAALFDVLEHIKYPAAVMEWLPVQECIVNVPAASIWMQRIEEYVQGREPDFQHLCSWSLNEGQNFLGQCGWRVMESGYLFDNQSWKGRVFSALVASRLPRLFAQGVWFHCKRG